MKNELIRFLAEFPEIKEDEIEAIADCIPTETFKKGTVLLKAGEVPDRCFFVLKGCVREYRMMDGEEKTTAFYTESNGAISSSHYVNQTPSGHYLICMEDSLVVSGNAKQDAANYEKFPVLKSITGQMMESMLNDTKDAFAQFVTSTPVERYQHFIKTHPDLVHRVPQHQIASLLGMTPESLSRIRKRLSLRQV